MLSGDKCQPIRDALAAVREVKEEVKAALHRLATAEMKLQLQLEECENEPPAGT